ncbi:MAG: uncharacterized protein KVP18_003736 [Porospora cf. gigantea A]|uniref:uncharacterized protein n=2 Tax=Porospora cf. gigantea A TaxID=2853593 RepID=UPI003559ACA0|nr:MAG: hypothetical protein KVP18_003736 [Porospora cf. gigantea A]
MFVDGFGTCTNQRVLQEELPIPTYYDEARGRAFFNELAFASDRPVPTAISQVDLQLEDRTNKLRAENQALHYPLVKGMPMRRNVRQRAFYQAASMYYANLPAELSRAAEVIPNFRFLDEFAESVRMKPRLLCRGGRPLHSNPRLTTHVLTDTLNVRTVIHIGPPESVIERNASADFRLMSNVLHALFKTYVIRTANETYLDAKSRIAHAGPSASTEQLVWHPVEVDYLIRPRIADRLIPRRQRRALRGGALRRQDVNEEDLNEWFSDSEDCLGRLAEVDEINIKRHEEKYDRRKQAHLEGAHPQDNLPLIAGKFKELGDRQQSQPLKLDQWGANRIHRDLYWNRKLETEKMTSPFCSNNIKRLRDRKWLHLEVDPRLTGNMTGVDLKVANEVRYFVGSLMGKDLINPTRHYTAFLTSHKHVVRKFFQLVLTVRPPIFICGGLGRDLVGVLCALLLQVLGASREEILVDYSASDLGLRDWKPTVEDNVRKFGLPDVFASCPAFAIERLLDWIDEEHGGIAKYMADLGFDEHDLAALKHKFIRSTALTPDLNVSDIHNRIMPCFFASRGLIRNHIDLAVIQRATVSPPKAPAFVEPTTPNLDAIWKQEDTRKFHPKPVDQDAFFAYWCVVMRTLDPDEAVALLHRWMEAQEWRLIGKFLHSHEVHLRRVWTRVISVEQFRMKNPFREDLRETFFRPDVRAQLEHHQGFGASSVQELFDVVHHLTIRLYPVRWEQQEALATEETYNVVQFPAEIPVDLYPRGVNPGWMLLALSREKEDPCVKETSYQQVSREMAYMARRAAARAFSMLREPEAPRQGQAASWLADYHGLFEDVFDTQSHNVRYSEINDWVSSIVETRVSTVVASARGSDERQDKRLTIEPYKHLGDLGRRISGVPETNRSYRRPSPPADSRAPTRVRPMVRTEDAHGASRPGSASSDRDSLSSETVDLKNLDFDDDEFLQPHRSTSPTPTPPLSRSQSSTSMPTAIEPEISRTRHGLPVTRPLELAEGANLTQMPPLKDASPTRFSVAKEGRPFFRSAPLGIVYFLETLRHILDLDGSIRIDTTLGLDVSHTFKLKTPATAPVTTEEGHQLGTMPNIAEGSAVLRDPDVHRTDLNNMPNLFGCNI